MLERFQRHFLIRKMHKIENYSASKKTWGNNITTLVVVNAVVIDHYELFDKKEFIDRNNDKTISVTFDNIEGLIGWLRDVKVLLTDVVNGLVTEIPQDKQYLNNTTFNDVPVNNFIRDKNGYVIDLDKANKQIQRLISEIGVAYESISSNKRAYFDMRLVNGLNTLLLFNELLLEVMMYGK